jgi:hypothetical protein
MTLHPSPRPRPAPLLAIAALALTLAVACSSATGPNGLGAPIAGDSVLFVGNSLTYWNEMPGMVQALSDAEGTRRLAVYAVAKPDYGLEEHWLDGDAKRAIAIGGWKQVILQQGPSSLDASRLVLRDYAARFAQEIRRVAAAPALYQVWPQQNRQQDFTRANESYRLAAQDVNGTLFPVGEAWLAAWQREPSLALYSSDGLHPSIHGSYLAAIVIYARLAGRSPVGLPARLTLRSGAVVQLPEATARVLQEAAGEVLR